MPKAWFWLWIARGHLLHGDAELRHAVGAQPDPHRDVGQAEHRGAVRARHALQLVEHVQVGVVVDIGGVVALVGRVDRDHHHDAGRLLVHHQPLLRHHLRQLRHGLAQLVLHVDLVDVRVAARLEHDHDLGVAAGGAGRVVVQQVVHAVQLRLDRRGDVVGDHLGGRAGIARVDGDLRRRHVRVLLDRRDGHRHRARQHDQDRDDRREDRPVDEEVGEHRRATPIFWLRRSSTSAAWRAATCQADRTPGSTRRALA